MGGRGRMAGEYFALLWIALGLLTGTNGLLCYWCSGVGSDRDCERHPYAVRTGPIYINCPSRFCITAKVTDAMTGEVQSFARLCDNIPRGNQCVRDSRLLTCYESCTTDLCNNGNPGPEYLETVNYASYDSGSYDARKKTEGHAKKTEGDKGEQSVTSHIAKDVKEEKKNMLVNAAVSGDDNAGNKISPYIGLKDISKKSGKAQSKKSADWANDVESGNAISEKHDGMADHHKGNNKNKNNNAADIKKSATQTGEKMSTKSARGAKSNGSNLDTVTETTQNQISKPVTEKQLTKKEDRMDDDMNYEEDSDDSPVLSIPFVISTTEDSLVNVQKVTERSSKFGTPESSNSNKATETPKSATQTVQEDVVAINPFVHVTTGTVSNTDGRLHNGAKVNKSEMEKAASQKANDGTKTTGTKVLLQPTKQSHRLVIDQHPTAYLSLHNPGFAPEKTANFDEQKPNAMTSYPRSASLDQMTSNPHSSSPDVMTSYPPSSSTEIHGHRGHLVPVIAGPRLQQYSEPANTFIVTAQHNPVPLNPSTARSPRGPPAYLYPIDLSTARFSHPTATNMIAGDFPQQLLSNAVLSAHQDKMKVKFHPSFTDYKPRPIVVPEPNAYSAFQPTSQQPALFFSETVREFSEKNRDSVIRREQDKVRSPNLIQPVFKDFTDINDVPTYIDDITYAYDVLDDGDGVTGVMENNDAAFVESGYKMDSLDNLVSAFRQHPGNRYSNQGQEPDLDLSNRTENSIQEVGSLVSDTAAPPSNAPVQDQNGNVNTDDMLTKLLEETRKQTGGIFVTSLRVNPTAEPNFYENSIHTPPPAAAVTELDSSILITDAPSKLILESKYKSVRASNVKSQSGSHTSDATESRKTSESTTTSGSTTTVSGSQAAPTGSTLPTKISTLITNDKLEDVTVSSVLGSDLPLIAGDSALNKPNPGYTESLVISATPATGSLTARKATTPSIQDPTATVVIPDEVRTIAVPKTVTFPWTSTAAKNGTDSKDSSLTVVFSFVNSSITRDKPQKQIGNPLSSSAILGTTHQYASSDETGISFVTEPQKVIPASTLPSSQWRTSRIADTTQDAFLSHPQSQEDQTNSPHEQDEVSSKRGLNKYSPFKPFNRNGRQGEKTAPRPFMNFGSTESSRDSQFTSTKTPASTPSYAILGTSTSSTASVSLSSTPNALYGKNTITVRSSFSKQAVPPTLRPHITTPSSVSNETTSPSSLTGSTESNATENVAQRPKGLLRKPSGPTLASLNSQGQMDSWGHVHSSDVEKSKGHELSPAKSLVVLTILSFLLCR